MRKNKKISDSERLEIIKDYYLGNETIYTFEKKRGISSGRIKVWMRNFGLEEKKETEMKEKENPSRCLPEEDVRQLKLRIKELEHKLKESNMSRDTYLCMIDLAEKRFSIPIRKKSDAK